LFVSRAQQTRSNALQFVRVTGTNIATKCSRRVRAYSKEQLGVCSICLSFEGGATGAVYVRMRNNVFN